MVNQPDKSKKSSDKGSSTSKLNSGQEYTQAGEAKGDRNKKIKDEAKGE